MFHQFRNREKTVKVIMGTWLALLVGLGMLSALQLPTLETQYAIEQFFPKADVDFENAKKIREKYKLSENPAVVAVIEWPAGETWLKAKRADELRAATETWQQHELVTNSISFATRAGAEMSAENIQVGRISEILPETAWENRFAADPLMTPLLLSKDARRALLYLELKDADLKLVQPLFGALTEDLLKRFPGATVRIGGIPAMQAAFQVLLEAEVLRFIGFALLASIFVIVVLFRNLSAWLAAGFTVFLANVVVLGAMAVFGFPLSVLTATVPILVTVTVVPQIVHTFFRLFEGRDDLTWILHYRVQKDLFLPNFLANLTTAVGFATLMPSEIPVIADYGVVVASVILVSWLVTSALLPALTLFMKAPVPREWAHLRARWVLLILKNAKAVSVSVIVFSVVAAFGALMLNWGARVFDDLPANDPHRLATELIDREMGGTIPLDIEITASNENFWKDPTHLARLNAVSERLRGEPGVGQVLSAVEFLRAFGGDGKSASALPATSAAVAELMFLYSLSDGNPLRNYISHDQKSVRVQIRLRDIPATQMISLVEKIRADYQAQFPELAIGASGLAKHMHPINNRISKQLIFGFWEAMLGIFLVLALAFRSLRWALVACLPNLVPPALLLGLLAATQVPITPPLALIFSISLGLAFNNTIYVFARLRARMKERRLSRITAHVFHREGLNCLHSTLVVMAGFAVFLFAQFSVNQMFGTFMLLSIVAGLIGDLIFLPALLHWKPGLLGLTARPTQVAPPILLPGLLPVPATGPAFELDENQRSSPMLSKAASFLLFAFILTGSPRVQAAGSLEQRFKSALKQFESKDESAKVKITIIESDGSRSARELSLQRSGMGGEQRMVARILAPADLKGTSLLSIVTAEHEDQWIYLPSSKQVRKVVSKDSGDSGVLGSELRYEDFDPSVIRATRVTLKGSEPINGKIYDILEAAVPPGQTSFDRAQIWVSQDKDLPVRIEYFAKSQKLKTIQFAEYKKVGKVLRPHKVVIKNLKNKRGTEIELSQVKINSGVSPKKLSVDSLAKAW